MLDLSALEVLTTTRAVRKRLDFERPVELDVIEECMQIALQAPSGSNAQGWHFVVITDQAKRKAIGDFYRQAFEQYRSMPVSVHALEQNEAEGQRKEQMKRVTSSAEYLGQNMGRAPALLIACIEGRVDGVSGPGANVAHSSHFGSILPALWSFMLAARMHGIGTSWTTLHLMFERQVAELLGIPYDSVTQTALTPIAYTRGTEFKAALRRDLDQVLHVDSW
jgi:nitroreductase